MTSPVRPYPLIHSALPGMMPCSVLAPPAPWMLSERTHAASAAASTLDPIGNT
eukprot:CAMPEP_0114157966 /NCGR_PEP_ID=MMETSP0043_2-20121206/26924_1 /TAXON_ID=464988 /ORGANISM="Hemiselmis andersenii, Strain CCMP644" /LENGTH=52 /DNA_ID=CAMNT_0001253611 /DNA_START=551 /DNA_END=706 /DNA_ORIENTATION=-